MASNSVKLLLVTANVGSVFEDPSRLLKAWLQEFLSKITLLKPQCLALHLQEVGGKTYEKSMEYVQEFIQKLCESEELNEYNCIRVYLDEDYNSAEHFTALGNLYFMHHSLTSVRIWNFLTHEWEIAEGKNIHTGNIEAIATKEKSKFPQHFFPECKWSRKGFMRVRWDINGTVLDLVNIHLFHDASNLAACEQFPSIYCKTRRRALVHTLERFHIDSKNGFAPFFIFGDFNFRCDTAGVIQELTKDLTSHRIQNLKNDSTKIQYRDDTGENVLTVGKKEFNHSDHQIKFKESWLQKFDKELDPLRKILYEYPITFSPSYPYEEEPNMPTSYMSTRCPAWCDRIVLNLTAKNLISESEVVPENYNIIGENICMGDHKPIYLCVQLKTNQGIYRCCNCYQHANSPNHIVSASDHTISNFNKLQNNSLCFYNNSEFNKNLIECNKLDLKFKCPKTTSKVQLNSNNISISSPTDDNNLNAIDKTTRLDSNNKDLSQQQPPLISINITDSDNLNICMCRILTENFKAKLKSPESDDDQIDGTICPECRNIIKKQPIEHRCTLISKRLMLANNIIVNRIDTHYLNTHLDHHHEPYTPESAESHSPCPEYETNSGDSQTESEFMTYDDTNNVNNSNSHNLSHQQLLNTNANNIHSGKLIRTESRGIVLPGQLKSRLEHLQRTSLNNDEINTTSQINKNSMGNGCFKCCVIL